MILVVLAAFGGWLVIVALTSYAIAKKPLVEVLSVRQTRAMERASPGESEDEVLHHLYMVHPDAWCGLSINASMKSFRQAHKRAHAVEGTELHSCGRISVAPEREVPGGGA